MKKKRSRKNNIKPIVITARDKEILARIAEYRILTTEQLHRLCFPSLSRARKRLLQLLRHGYLKRTVKPVRMGEGSSMFLYSLTKKAMNLLPANATNLKAKPSIVLNEHELGINYFRVCLQLSIRELEDISLRSWKQGKELLMKAVEKDKGTLKRIPIIPDAYFALEQDNKVFHFFLEIDRGTTDLKRIALKCRGYLNIWNDKIAHTQMGLRSFRVLYVTSSEKRMENMLEQLRKIKSLQSRTDIILITAADLFSLSKPDSIFKPIWKYLDSDGNIGETGLIPATILQSSRQRAENHHCAVQNPMSTNGHPGPGG